MGGGKDNLCLRVLACGNTLFCRRFYAVIHGVTDNMHDRVADAVHNCLIYFRILAYQSEAYVLIKLLLHITDNTVHLLECS